MAAAPSLYERVLARIQAGEVELPGPPQPRPSAGVVPWRRRGDRLEVYWVRRAPTMPFMGGWHAFPGGGVSKRDRPVAVAGTPAGLEGAPELAALPEAVTHDVETMGPILIPGLLAAALRELFEEVGLLPGGTAADERAVEAIRRALLAKEIDFPGALERLGATPRAERLTYAGRWLTPQLGPMRFDNRFFLLEWPESERLQPRPDGGELEEGEWLEPAEAHARWESGDVITAPPILHILRVLAEEGPERGLGRLQAPEEANVGPHRIVEFRPGVLLFPLRTPTLPPAQYTNCYLLGGARAALVDPGSPDAAEVDRLAEALEAAADRLGRRAAAIWLTHHHPDHVGGVARLAARLGVPVRAHAATAELLAGRGFRVEGSLEEGQVHDLGGADRPFPVRVFHTPGHAPGHLTFLDETHGSLLAGDLVSSISMIVVDPPHGDMDDYLASLERMRDLGARTLFPGHGPTLADPAGRFREVLDHRLWREERILEAWEGGLRSPGEMIPTVYDDVPEVAWPLAERQALAHLERLRRMGRIDG